jgi:hypothetical protein
MGVKGRRNHPGRLLYAERHSRLPRTGRDRPALSEVERPPRADRLSGGDIL